MLVHSQHLLLLPTDNAQLAFNTAVTVSRTYTGAVADATVLAGAINNANIENVSATVNAQNKVTISALGGEIKFVDTNGVLTEAGINPIC